MKHKNYHDLIQALDSLTTGMHGADTLRAVYEKHQVEVQAKPGEPTTKREPTDQAKQHPLFKHRSMLLLNAMKTVDDVATMMEQWVDEFIEENQGRADQGWTPTPDGRALFNAMSRFMSATDTPIPGAVNLYDSNHVVTAKSEHDGGVFSRDVFVHGVRTQCREWMDRMIAWFPDLNPDNTTDQAGNPRPADGPVNVAPGMSDHEMRVEQFRTQLSQNPAYKLAVANGHITNPFTWNESLYELVKWLIDWENNMANPLIPTRKRGGKTVYWWCYADGLFSDKDGGIITAQSLSTANKNLNRN